jgi:hypothetical protein
MHGHRRLGQSLRLISIFLTAVTLSPSARAENASGQPVLIELFTSEGCSSCPPADRIAIGLQSSSCKGQELIILSEHVDYWNNIGWRDRYSSPLFTARQQGYAKSLGQNSVYTPEAVVDGLYGMVGSNAGSLHDAIQKCSKNAKASVRLSVEEPEMNSADKRVSVSASSPPNLDGKRVQLFIAVTEDNLSSNVRSGENAGAVLSHTGVVRSLKRLGSEFVLDRSKDITYSTKITVSPQWKERDLRVIAFLQEPSTQRIWGAGQVKMR